MMRRLAAELGVQPSALYHHVPNKQTLLEAVADEILIRGRRLHLDQAWDQRVIEICFIGVVGFLPPPIGWWTAGQVAEYFVGNEVRIGLCMEGVIIFGLFYLLWNLAVARVMERAERGLRLLSRVQF